MKKNTRILLCIIALMLMTGSTIRLKAQTWTSIDGGGTAGINSATATTSKNPSVSVYNGSLYAIWYELSSTDEIHIKKYNGSTWENAGSSGSKINENTGGADGPKIVSCNGKLYAAWKGYEDTGYGVQENVRVKEYNGTSWSYAEHYAVGDTRKNINWQLNANGKDVDLLSFNNELYATWIECANVTGIRQVRISKFNGSVWTSIDGNGTYGLNYNTGYNAVLPRFGVYNNKVYVTWTEDNSTATQLRVKRYDGGSTWTFVDGNGVNGLNYDVAQNAAAPVIASYNNNLYLFWHEYNSTNGKTIVRVKRYDGTSWTTTPDGGGWFYTSNKSTMFPSAFVYNNLLYVSWEENKAPYQIRVVSFDGTAKTFIDGNDVSGINQNISMRAHNPKLIKNGGDLYDVWNEDNSGSDNAQQIRAKKTILPPFVESVTVPANGTYIIGQTLNFTVNYSKNVTVAGGTPNIPITLNTGGTVNAVYISGSGTSALTFRYTIVTGSVDIDGISVGTAISNGGATLQSQDATPLSANLTLNSVGSTSSVFVDGIAPTVTSINLQTPATSPTNASSLVYRVTFNETVTGVGTSDFTLTTSGGATGGTIASVTAVSGSIYDVTVNSLQGYGTFRLDLNSSGTGIMDTPGNAISGGYAAGQTYTTLTAGTFTGATNTDWNTATNWASSSVPTSSTDVTIPSGKTVIIGPTTTAQCNHLTVSGTLTIQSSASGTGSLIVSGTSTGTVNCERYMTNGKWHLITPPASGQTVATFLAANTNIPTSGSTRGMMDYNTLGNSWNVYYPTSSATGTMDAGKGYSARIATTDGTITFAGTLTSGTKAVTLTNTGQGWNCVGNPYTSAINMNTTAHATNNFISVNSSNLDASYACVYVWDEDATYTGQNCYKVISNSGFSTTKTLLSQNYVAPGQGFFVKAKTGATSISFTNAMQSAQVSTTFRAPAATTSWPGIVLNTVGANTSSSAIITFNSNMTRGLDPTYDAGLLRGTNGLSVYTRLVEDNGVDFAIQCLPENYANLVVTVGVDCSAGGEITFSAESVNLPASYNVVLEDRANNTFTSLAGGATYKTTVSAGSTAVGRFYVRTVEKTATGTTGLTADINSLKAYIANEAILIEGEVSEQVVATLYNLQGMKIGVNPLQKGHLNTIPCSNLAKGIYFITVQQNGKIATKKIIKE